MWFVLLNVVCFVECQVCFVECLIVLLNVDCFVECGFLELVECGLFC